jgi:hypothetical protein
MLNQIKLTLLGGLCSALFGCASVPIPGPSNLAITTSADGAHLSWNDVYAPDVEISVERKAEGGRFESIARLPGTAVAYLDLQAKPPCAYRVVAFASGSLWSGTYSKEVRLP